MKAVMRRYRRISAVQSAELWERRKKGVIRPNPGTTKGAERAFSAPFFVGRTERRELSNDKGGLAEDGIRDEGEGEAGCDEGEKAGHVGALLKGCDGTRKRSARLG